jgi:hypothetical protein
MFDFNIYSFEQQALETFHFQSRENDLYRQYISLLRKDAGAIRKINEIPFLPIRFFKSHEIKTTVFEGERVFESSGTTKTGNSRHFVKDAAIYRKSFTKAFNIFYGDPKDWCILALLPSYLERNNSSLVMMVDELIRLSGHPESGFYLDQFRQLKEKLQILEARGQKTLLLGVTFALLDFFEEYPMKLENTVIMETGGMKGRKEELTRDEVHRLIKSGSGVKEVHSEYGMTELLSQAYSSGDGIFRCPPWMKIVLRAEDDPLGLTDAAGRPLKEGLINVIDLANRYSCSFIATDDMGRLNDNGSVEVIGRVDNSDIRGCSLMVV